jgi:S-adenosylmethionine:tRNA ribosyltransferase-isomerase
VRSLESLYWLGIRLIEETNIHEEVPLVDQWFPYQEHPSASIQEALDAVIVHMEKNETQEIHFSTRLMIAPGYRFRVVNRLITNFHQPGSTLLLLIAAFTGKDWRRIYDYALANGFRFLSYGDSSLLEIHQDD